MRAAAPGAWLGAHRFRHGQECTRRPLLLPSVADSGEIVDHAAQFAAATTPAFQAFMRGLEAEGLVKLWRGKLGHIDAAGRFDPFDDAVARYVGSQGMSSIAAAIARGVEVRQDAWVLPSGGLQQLDGGGLALRLPKSAGKASTRVLPLDTHRTPPCRCAACTLSRRGGQLRRRGRRA